MTLEEVRVEVDGIIERFTFYGDDPVDQSTGKRVGRLHPGSGDSLAQALYELRENLYKGVKTM